MTVQENKIMPNYVKFAMGGLAGYAILKITLSL